MSTLPQGKWFYPEWHDCELYDSWICVGWGSTMHDDYPADDLHLHEFPYGEPPSNLALAIEILDRMERGG
jgi:hypothetical protein